MGGETAWDRLGQLLIRLSPLDKAAQPACLSRGISMRRNGTSGQTITSSIYCCGITVGNNGSLYAFGQPRMKHDDGK